MEQWGLESRPLGGLVDFIKNTTNPMQHVTEGCQLQPINVENGNNGNATRTEKHLGWSTEEDLRLLDKSNKRKRDYADAIPLDDEEIPRPMGVKAAKAQRIGKGKGKVQDCNAELEDDIHKFMDAHEAAKEQQSKLLETQRRVASDNLEAKKVGCQTAMIAAYRELLNKDTRDMPDDVRYELVAMLKCMREDIFQKTSEEQLSFDVYCVAPLQHTSYRLVATNQDG